MHPQSFEVRYDLKDPRTSKQPNLIQLWSAEKIRESYESGILSMVKSNNRITRKEMAEKLSISLRSLRRIINKMDELHYVGSGNHGHWEIKHD